MKKSKIGRVLGLVLLCAAFANAGKFIYLVSSKHPVGWTAGQIGAEAMFYMWMSFVLGMIGFVVELKYKNEAS